MRTQQDWAIVALFLALSSASGLACSSGAGPGVGIPGPPAGPEYVPGQSVNPSESNNGGGGGGNSCLSCISNCNNNLTCEEGCASVCADGG
jgi:hypothetical protein